MKIIQGSIAMSSSRMYQKSSVALIKTNIFTGRQTSSKNDSTSATLNLSNQAKEVRNNLRQRLNLLDAENRRSSGVNDVTSEVMSKEDANVRILKKLLELLKLLREGKNPYSLSKPDAKEMNVETLDLRSTGNQAMGTGTVWTRQTSFQSHFHEEEATSFSSTGSVITSDGRTIDFNVQLEMSRSFTEETSYIKNNTISILTDPLIINLDVATAEVTDQKFLFDINADGEMDEISFLKEGSGFLSLDKNNDGVINDGSELFGTKSQDGFKDLAAYDDDHNGWIDENDDVFKKLRIWTKDSEGNDKLINLADADVGAIYLGNVNTEFSLNNQETNTQNAQIKKTGIYIKESGAAATIQHVDLAL